MIAAGSTASVPATATLLATISLLPHGAVVLPGLDTHLSDTTWELIPGKRQDGREIVAPAVGHPQFAIHALLKRLGADRTEVTALGGRAPHGREKLVSEALCPAAGSECWQQRLPAETIRAALADVAVIEAGNAEEESLAIAVALREALETHGARAALVTPDRALARRVVAALARWNVAVDESGGEPLADTPAGVFARLAAEAALGDLAPVTLLAVLKHPLLRLRLDVGARERTIGVLERAILRGPRPRPRTAGLAHALATFRRERPSLHRSDPRRKLTDAELDRAEDLIARLRDALSPLETLGKEQCSLQLLAERHRDVIAALSQDGGETCGLAGHDGAVLLAALEELVATPAADLAIAPTDYPDLFRALMADRAVRRPDTPGVRVKIFGLLEARLQSVDTLVLGGLQEGTWPPEVRGDAWLSRPMRHDLGLDLPERRIGLTAHDFAQALGAPKVVPRAAKVGVPHQWSRFVSGWRRWPVRRNGRSGAARCALSRSGARLDRPQRPERIKAPAPPPVAAPDRPR